MGINNPEAPGHLSLLQDTLTELWQRGHERGRLTFADYKALGEIQGALRTRADQLYNGLNTGEQAVAEWIFVELTELGEGTEDTRRRVGFAEVVPAGAEASRIRGADPASRGRTTVDDQRGQRRGGARGADPRVAAAPRLARR